jgi:hypothetical protein
MSFSERVAVTAAEVRPLRVVLTVLAAPVWMVGFVVGLLWVAALWLFAAAAVGFGDARRSGGSS